MREKDTSPEQAKSPTPLPPVENDNPLQQEEGAETSPAQNEVDDDMDLGDLDALAKELEEMD